VPEAAATLRVVDYTMKRDADGQYRRLPVSDSMKHMVTVTQPWPTAEGRWFLPHFNLPHLERRVLDVLECESTPASVWNSVQSCPPELGDQRPTLTPGAMARTGYLLWLWSGWSGDEGRGHDCADPARVLRAG
jgi:hypothetical protein